MGVGEARAINNAEAWVQVWQGRIKCTGMDAAGVGGEEEGALE
jgi:hypothetical protein